MVAPAAPGEALETGGAGEDRHVLAALAHHFCAATAADFTLAAAHQAMEQAAWKEAAELLEAGLPALEQAGAAHRERRYDLLLGLAVRSARGNASQGEKRGRPCLKHIGCAHIDALRPTGLLALRPAICEAVWARERARVSKVRRA